MSYGKLSLDYYKVKNKNIREIGDLIGGKVKEDTEIGVSKNASVLRLSYAFNKAGYAINKSDGAISSGDDNKWHLYNTSDMIKYAQKIAKEVLKGEKPSDFSGKRGIIAFGDCSKNDSMGNIYLFDGIEVEGDDYPKACKNITLYVL